MVRSLGRLLYRDLRPVYVAPMLDTHHGLHTTPASAAVCETERYTEG